MTDTNASFEIPKRDHTTIANASAGTIRNFFDLAGNYRSIDESGTQTIIGANNAAATSFTPDGDIAATNVQAAIVEVRDDIPAKIAGMEGDILYVSMHGDDATISGTLMAPYRTITAALTRATTIAAANNMIVIEVEPGLYIEPQLDVPSYVTIKGSSLEATLIQANANNHHVLSLSQFAEVNFLTVQGAGSGYAGIACIDSGDYTQAHKVSFIDCDICLLITSSTVNTFHYNEYTDYGGTYSYGTKIIASGGFEAVASLENHFNLPTATTAPHIFNYAEGIGAKFSIPLSGNVGTNVETAVYLTGGAKCDQHSTFFEELALGIYIEEGSEAVIAATTFDNCALGVQDKPTGTVNDLRLSGCQFIGTTKNLEIKNSTGNFTGYSAYTITEIADSAGFFITNKDSKIVTVAKKGGDFSTVGAALTAIAAAGNASSSLPYLISVGPGIFIESPLTMLPHVRIKGQSAFSTILACNTTTGTLITACPASGLFSIGLTGTTGAGGKLIYFSSAASMDIFEINSCLLGSTETVIDMNCPAGVGYVSFRSCDFSTTWTTCFKLTASASLAVPAILTVTNAAISNTNNSGNPKVIIVTGVGAQFAMGNGLAKQYYGLGTFCEMTNGALVTITGFGITNFDHGYHVTNSGSAPTLKFIGDSACDTYDYYVDHPGTLGLGSGGANKNKVYVNSNAPFAMNFAGGGDAGQVVLQSIYQGDRYDRLVNVSEMVRLNSTVGVGYGGELSINSGLSIHVTAGTGYLLVSDVTLPAGHYLIQVSWDATDITLTASSENWIYVNSAGVVSHSSSPQDMFASIDLGKVHTLASTVDFFGLIPRTMHHQGNWVENVLRESVGAIFASGCAVAENAIPYKIDIGSGEYYYGTKEISPAGGTAVTFDQYYKNGAGGWTISSTDTVNHANYDDGDGTLHSLGTGLWAKHSLYLVGDNAVEKYFLVLGQEEFSSLVFAQAGNIPSPPVFFNESVVLIATIIVKEGTANITEIRDERPRIGFKPSATAGVTVHGDLSGLSADDHTQYLLVSGSRAMTAPLNMGAQNIANVGTVDGVTVSAHEARHLPNGSDPITTGAGIALTGSSAVGVGVANSLSRSDHSHSITLTATNVGLGSVVNADTTTTANITDSTNKRFVTDANLVVIGNTSNTNTGDQTITLTGGVTGAGTGSFAATVVTNANLTGDVTSSGNATSIAASTITGKLLTGFAVSSGAVAATDTILQGFNKLAFTDLYNINKKLNASFTTTIATNTNTALSFSALANTSYIVEAHVTTQCSGTGGMKYQITAPTASTVEGWVLASGAAILTQIFQRFVAINTLNTTAMHTVATTPGPDRIYAVVNIGATPGTVAIGAASVTAGQTTTIFLNSFVSFDIVTGV